MNQTKNTYRVLGVMSGTSIDGLDMALCTFTHDNGSWSYKIDASETIEYEFKMRQKLENAYHSSGVELARLDVDLGRFIGASAKLFLEDKGEVDIIASHGHTIYHNPAEGFTCQIGSGAEIAAQSGVKTICDFRSSDVAKGGQGAPLVPLGDELLFGDYDACVNIGGFANISLRKKGSRVAYDICPVNFVLNRLANKLQLAFDDGGKVAESGVVMLDVYVALNANEYFSKQAPKSLGQEWVEENVFTVIQGDYDVSNVLRTYCEHVSYQIAQALNATEGDSVLFTGGGVNNSFLMQMIQTKTKKKIIVPDALTVDMKEALIFALLGVLRLRGEVNSWATVTGAPEDVVNGAVYLP